MCVHGTGLAPQVSNNQLSKVCRMLPKGGTDLFSLCWTASPYLEKSGGLQYPPALHLTVKFDSNQCFSTKLYHRGEAPALTRKVGAHTSFPQEVWLNQD